MTIRAEEITDILRREIVNFDQPTVTVDVGTVTEVGDGIARIYGLSGVRSSELV